MKRTITVFIVVALLATIAVAQWRNAKAFAYLEENGELGDWEFCGQPLAQDSTVPHWLPGMWPRKLKISAIPDDTDRYCAAARRIPRLDEIEVFVEESLSQDIFDALGSIPDVRVLDLMSPSVNDSGFQSFAQFESVRKLYLASSTITDGSIDHILKFRSVFTIGLNNNPISDSNILKLAELPALRELILFEELLPETIATLRLKRSDIIISL